jgi:protein-export membrane protein SecD
MGYFLLDSFIYYSKPQVEREKYVETNPNILKRIVNLGLDLQGGMRLVLEIDRTNIDKEQDKDLQDRAFTVIQNRINGLGVAEPSIQKQGRDRIIVELPGLKDEKRAKDILGRTAQLEFKLLREPAQLEQAINIIDNVVAGKLQKDSAGAAAPALDTAAKKQKESQTLAEKLFKGADEGKDTAKAVADTAGGGEETEAFSFKDLLAGYQDQIAIKFVDIPKVNECLRRTEVRAALERAGLGGNQFLWGFDTVKMQGEKFRSLYYVKAMPEMRGDAIRDARSSLDQSGVRMGGPKVDLEMNPRGARRFAVVTGNNVNRFLAIVLDSTVYSAPRIIQKIAGGNAEITGSFTIQEASALAIVLRAGALPAPVKIIEERTVGPSLGQDSIEKSVLAGIVGGALVILFVLVYYQLSGAIAVLTILLNILGVLAVMAGFNATLTLPGIAGILLQIGMGVDANVLIYERIREELRTGKTVRSAIKAGFDRALITIVDSNLTTIATALILFWKGTGAIKGFALTLTFGLIISLYMALFVTKVLLDIAFAKAKDKMSI